MLFREPEKKDEKGLSIHPKGESRREEIKEGGTTKKKRNVGLLPL